MEFNRISYHHKFTTTDFNFVVPVVQVCLSNIQYIPGLSSSLISITSLQRQGSFIYSYVRYFPSFGLLFRFMIFHLYDRNISIKESDSFHITHLPIMYENLSIVLITIILCSAHRQRITLNTAIIMFWCVMGLMRLQFIL